MADQVGKTEAEKQINLSALRKHDAEIDKIVDTASSVAHYKFNASSGVWEKTEVEGSLFLYSRKVSPYVIIFIMNRLNTQNTKMILSSEMEFKIQEPFLLCKGSSGEIIGIWFYDQKECQRFGSLLSKLALIAKDEASLRVAVQAEANKKSPAKECHTGIMGMFTKAHESYKKKQNIQQSMQEETKQEKSLKPNKSEHLTKPVMLKRILSEPGTNQQKSSRSPVNQRHSPNLRKQQLQDSHKKSPRTNRKNEIRKKQEEFKEKHLKEQETLLNILHGGEVRKPNRTRTMSTAETTEDERFTHDYSSTAGDLVIFGKLGVLPENVQHHHTNHNNVASKNVIDCAALESAMLDSNNSSSNSLHHVKSLPSFTEINSDSPVIDNKSVDTRLTPQARKNSLSDNTRSSGSTTKSTPNLPLTLSSNYVTNSPVSLLSPTVITAKSGGKGRGTTLNTIMNGQQTKPALAANFPKATSAKKLFPDEEKPDSTKTEPPSTTSLNALMSPAAFQSKSIATAPTHKAESAEPNLTKQQFQEALLYMIENDQNFVTRLHTAYLEVRKKR